MPPTKKIARPTPGKVTMQSIRRAVTDFLHFDDTASKFAAQATEVKMLLRDTVLPAQGTEDENKHRWIMWEDDPIEDPSGKGSVIGIKRERRAPKTLNPDKAEVFLRKRGLWDQCIEQVEVINEDAILALAFDKTITEKELDDLYDTKESFAFVPQRRK